MKSIFLISLVLFISNCSQYKISTENITYNEPTNTASGASLDAKVINEDKSEKILESGVSYEILQKIYKDTSGVEQEIVELYYISTTGRKILIATTSGGQIFKDIKIDSGYLYFTYSGTGGQVINIVNLTSMKIVARISGGKYTDDRKYLYSCSEGGYGPGEASIVDLKEMKSYNAFAFIYNQDKISLEKEINSIKCDLKKSNGVYNMEFSTRKGYDNSSEFTQYNFNFNTKELTNFNTQEIVTIPTEVIPENLYAK